MSYPQAPDFTSAGPDVLNPPAWWIYTRDDGSTNVCETTGAAAVRRARAALGLSNIATWDADLQNALIAKAQTLASAQSASAWAPLISNLQTGLSQQQVSTTATQFAIWVAYYQPNGLRLDAISVDASSLLPGFGVTLPDGPQGDVLVCLDPAKDVQPGQYSASDLATVQSQSIDGIRLHPGELLPAPQGPVPPGVGGIDNTTLIVIGVALIAVTAVVVYVNTRYVETATNVMPPRAPSRRSARIAPTARTIRSLTRGPR